MLIVWDLQTMPIQKYLTIFKQKFFNEFGIKIAKHNTKILTVRPLNKFTVDKKLPVTNIKRKYFDDIYDVKKWLKKHKPDNTVILVCPTYDYSDIKVKNLVVFNKDGFELIKGKVKEANKSKIKKIKFDKPYSLRIDNLNIYNIYN